MARVGGRERRFLAALRLTDKSSARGSTQVYEFWVNARLWTRGQGDLWLRKNGQVARQFGTNAKVVEFEKYL